jgi:hypothetical protein
MPLAPDADEDRAAQLTHQVEPVAPWRVVSVSVVGETDLQVRFVDGIEGFVHMRHLIWSEGAGVFEALRDPAVFRRAGLELGAVTWPGEIDLAPDVMHDEIASQGHWTPS